MYSLLKRVRYIRDRSANIWLTNLICSRMILLNKRRYRVSEEQLLNMEDTAEGKQAFVEAYRAKQPRLTKKFEEALQQFKEENPQLFEGKDDSLLQDMLFCKCAYGHSYDDFFGYQLETKSPAERKSYLSEREKNMYVQYVNGYVAQQYLFDKRKAYKKLKEFYKRECFFIKKPTDYEAFLAFAQRHPVFIKKQVDENSGRGVELIDTTNGQTDLKALFESYLKNGRTILEERIEQAQELAAFNPSSVNTVRAVVFKTKKGVQFPYAYFRMGRTGATVDNAAAGGVFTEVDTQTGITMTEGFDLFGRTCEVHPDTGFVLKGVQLPAWDELTDIITRATKKLPYMHYIGWDMAYTSKGWVIVEGNRSAHPAEQVALRRGVKDEFYAFKKDMPLGGRGR